MTHTPANSLSSATATGAAAVAGEEPEPAWEAASRRNFLVLAAYQIVLRTGWIFKTESIVMPAVLDSIAGAGWVRGWLPLLNRFGNSVPPLLANRRVKVTPAKKWLLSGSTGLMGLMFLLLAACFATPAVREAWWMPLVFLVIYTLFFVGCGISHLSFNTLQGKLILATRRGRLLLASNLAGALIAVSFAFVLLPRWLAAEVPRYDLVFAFSGLMFGSSALIAWGLREPRDQFDEPSRPLRQILVDGWQVWRTDRNFRRLTVVGALFSCSIMLFPHYQHLGLRGMQLELKSLMGWVVIQNIGTGLFSVPVGRVADRHGNRLVLLITLLGIASAPLLAIILSINPDWGSRFYFVVFLFVGLTPVVLRTIQNFTLELCGPEDHPRYLATLGICISLPMFASPLVGLAIDTVGFPAVFLTMAALTIASWMLAFGLREPRHHVTDGFWPSVD